MNSFVKEIYIFSSYSYTRYTSSFNTIIVYYLKTTWKEYDNSILGSNFKIAFLSKSKSATYHVFLIWFSFVSFLNIYNILLNLPPN